MLKKIITEGDLGLVIGDADKGTSCISPILTLQPDIVLIDFLMPELDGIETIEHLRKEGFKGQFIMISQVINKEMVGEAYEKGIEYFIHKPINRIEVQSILKKTEEQYRLKDSLLAIRDSLANITPSSMHTPKKSTVKEIVFTTLSNMGIVGEAGSEDIIAIMNFLLEEHNEMTPLPPLKELYEAVALKTGNSLIDAKRESKAMEQRLRRTILTAMSNLASLGAIDNTNPEFEYYAPRFFDFQEIRNQMIHIQEGMEDQLKVKVNNKKFLQVLYLEVLDKYKQSK